MGAEGERVRERDRSGPSCATCQGALDDGPPAICTACRAVHHAPCVSAERRCTCGAGLFVPTTRKREDVQLDAVLIAFLKRDLWKWLLPTPFWVISAWVLQTSERVWTETVLITGSRGGQELVKVAVRSRRLLVMSLLFFAIAPAFVAWFLRQGQRTTTASDHEPPPLWHRVVEWTLRLGALLMIASITHDLWRLR